MPQREQHNIMKRRITHVLFDLDGTLACSIPAMLAAYEQFLARFNINGSHEEFQELNGPTLREIVGILKTRHNLPDSHDELLALYTQEISRAYQDTVSPAPSATSILETLSNLGYRMALVTSNIQAIASEFIVREHWNQFFDEMIFGDDVAQSKPDSEIYELALSRCGIIATQAAAVEDSTNGIRAAAAAGVFAIGLAAEGNAAGLQSAGARIIIKSLAELPAALDTIHEEI